jgi:hypothetical protein
MIYTGKPVSREELRAIAVPERGARSERWQGVQHGELVDLASRRLAVAGFESTGEKWSTYGVDAAGLVGGFDIADPFNGGQIIPRKLQFGIIHDNASHRALTILVGAEIKLCSNGLIEGEFAVRCLHTNGLERRLEHEIDHAIYRWANMARGIEDRISRYRATGIDESDINNILMETGRQGILPWSHVGKVVEEYENPSFSEFKVERGTAWGLYGSFTHIAKQRPVHQQAIAINRFGQILDSRMELAQAA